LFLPQTAGGTASIAPGAGSVSLRLDIERAAAAPEPSALPPRPEPSSALTGDYGFIVMDAETGAVLEAKNADLPLAPASVAKLPTAVYALDRLGPAHRFATRVVATGPVRDGVLDGDLILMGGGEPALDSDVLADLAEATAAQVQRITGRFLVSHGGWPEIALIDGEQPAKASYNPAIAGLNLNFNRVRLAWDRKGQTLEAGLQAHAARSSPPVTAMTLTLEPDDCACPSFVHRVDAEGQEHWHVRRSLLRRTGAVWLPVRQPDRYAGEVFALAAAKAGLMLPEPQEAGPTDGTTLAQREGEPLVEQIADMLHYSNNMSAEVIGLAATRVADGDVDSLDTSAAAMNRWAARLGGFSARDGSFALHNHSGLSAASRVTPRRMAAFIVAALRHPRLGPLLEAVLKDHPVEAPSGSAAPSAQAKTGTMNFTRGLAGFITTGNGRRLVFAWFANDLARREAGLDEAGPGQGTRGWRNAAVHHERQLLTRWAELFDAEPTRLARD
jgi:D-alanyl-D-alanine carboxypeptidase/D-alanyl-D-alanine-endopeptidase (penicillin-binding protein 4)